MMRIGITIFVLFITINLMAAAVYAQDPAAAGFTDVSFWIVFLTTLMAGAVGGVVYELIILQGNIERPHKPSAEEVTEPYPHATVKNLYDLGIWARVIIGATAALAAWFVLRPSDAFSVLATALVAGSAGTSVFRSMQDRLLASMAQNDAANTRANASKQDAKVSEAMEAFANLKKKLMEQSSSRVGVRALSFGGETDVSMDPEDLDQVERLLSEARGIHEGS